MPLSEAGQLLRLSWSLWPIYPAPLRRKVHVRHWGCTSTSRHYSGSALFNGAVSAAVTTESELFPSSLGVSSSANPAPLGHAVSFYGSVPDIYGAGARRYFYVPTGTVTFYDGSTVIGAAQVPRFRSAKITVGGLTLGSHTITAVYSGDVDYAPASVTMTEVAGDEVAIHSEAANVTVSPLRYAVVPLG